MKINENIIVLDCSYKSKIYLIKEENGWVMIDTGFKSIYEEIVNELAKYDIHIKEIKRILLTHGDVDHVGNLVKITKASNCEVFANEHELPYLLKEKSYSLRKRIFKILLKIPKFKNIKPIIGNQIGDIRVIHTYGHTPGHTCYRYKKYLFVGDLFNTRNHNINLMDRKYTFDWTLYIQSLKMLDVQNIEYLCPSHGDIIKTAQYVEFIKNKVD